VTTIHKTRPVRGDSCEGEIRSYTYRYYAPSDSSDERRIGLAWCSTCREYSGAMLYVPPGEHPMDLHVGLLASEQERLARSEPFRATS
jgi:hypothetical protein